MGLKIVVACDKYKGSLSALEVCNTIAETIKEVDSRIDVVTVPVADGGEGTVNTLVESQNGKLVKVEVKGPLGEPVEASFGIIKGNIAVIEMAAASGVWLVPKDKRNPKETTTYGTGQLIEKALDMGCKKIIIGIGGSATTDAGMGMAQALGIKFYGKGNKELGLGGKQMKEVKKIDTKNIHPRVGEVEFDVACDVDNPLWGKRGAAYVYSPQKGADQKMVEELDRGLRNIAKVIKKDLGKDIGNIKGAGAAGGLGAGLAAFLEAELRPGVDIVIEAVSLEKKIKDCNLVISGEGSMDKQTYYGKSAYGVAKVASKYDIPVITINGSVFGQRTEIEKKYSKLFSGNFSIINRPMSLDEAIKNSRQLLKNASRELIIFYLNIIRKMRK